MIAKPTFSDHTAKPSVSLGSINCHNLVGMYSLQMWTLALLLGLLYTPSPTSGMRSSYMKVLHQLGFEKAFILTIEPQDTAFTLVIFWGVAWINRTGCQTQTVSPMAATAAATPT